MNEKVLQHYLQFSQYTDPGLYKEVVIKQIPDGVREIGKLVRTQIIHRLTLKNGNTGSNADLRYGDVSKVPWYRKSEDDIFVTSAAMLAELFRRDPRGLTLHRKAEDKLILTCRFISVLMATLLKLKEIPARVRSGFAPYFQVAGLPGGKSDDHWINEYWDKERSRWVTIDTDGSFEDYVRFDCYDIPKKTFDFAPDAWLSVRRKEIDGSHFYNASHYSGLVVVAWELFYDFHCLMNDEIIYPHIPKITRLGSFENLSESQLKEIDHLAELMQNPDENFKELCDIWETKREYRTMKGGLL